MLKVLALRHSKKLDSGLFQEILSLIDEDKQNKIMKYYKWQDAQRSLLGNFLARATLSAMFKIKNGDIRIKRSKMEKPYADNIPQAFFNISHSGDWIVGAFDNLPVGIDIEQIRDLDLETIKGILDTEDFEKMEKQVESERPSYFYKCWTYNESYLKMLGQGMSFPLSSISKLTEEACFKVYPIDTGYVLAVCSIGGVFPGNVTFTDIVTLLKTVHQEP